MLCAIRLAGPTKLAVAGGSTDTSLIGYASAPYKDWSLFKTRVTRLDGSVLFRHGGKTFAAGRFEPAAKHFLLKRGNLLVRKRTSLFRLEEQALVYLSDLPSGGDTSYPGAAILGNDLYMSYYTSDTKHDYPWFLGQLRPTQIRMARVALDTIPAESKLALPESWLPIEPVPDPGEDLP
jgi:hypothetical protein